MKQLQWLKFRIFKTSYILSKYCILMWAIELKFLGAYKVSLNQAFKHLNLGLSVWAWGGQIVTSLRAVSASPTTPVTFTGAVRFLKCDVGV